MDYGYGNGSAAGLGIILAVFAIEAGIIALAYVVEYILYGVALMLFFRKVGIDPRIAWIPVYRFWKWYEVGGQPGWWSIIGLVPYANIAASVFLCIGMWHTGKAFGKDAGMLVLGIFLPFVWLFVLASRNEVYRPEWVTAAGFPPPLAGYGSLQYAAAHPEEPNGPAAA